MRVLERIGDFVSKYMAVLVILMAGAAMAAPQMFVGIAPHVALLLGIIMFGMGTTLRTEDFRRIVKLLPLVSITVIILIVGGVVAVSAGRIKETGLLVMVVVICHNLLGYTIGFALSKALHMDMAKAKAIAIEVGMQNSGLAASLAMLHFGAAAAIPGAIFSVWHNISGSLAANYLSGRQEAGQKKE